MSRDAFFCAQHKVYLRKFTNLFMWPQELEFLGMLLLTCAMVFTFLPFQYVHYFNILYLCKPLISLGIFFKIQNSH